MSRIIFNLAAKCDAAGRSQNEDNYWVCPDLAKWNAPVDTMVGTDEDVELSDKGALLVVADGMGGMNAGEVASKLVIDGIKKKFSDIPDSILANEEDIKKFILSAIVEADESIKKYAKEHREAEGLGSTIVLLWLLNGRAFCGWCGDSRIYRFNPNNELVRLSHDHSYVQKLVDEGSITEEEAFDHPDGNLISKALGDNGNKADPEIRVYDVYARDVFMLCSDGLCGLLQDAELNEIISRDCTSSKETLSNLWQEGEKAKWSDNATIDVLCVVDGGKPAKGRPDGYPVVVKKPIEKKDQKKSKPVSKAGNSTSKRLSPIIYILATAAVCMLGFVLYYTFGGKDAEESTNHVFNVEVPEGSEDINGNASSNSTSFTNTQGAGKTNSNSQAGNNNNIGGGRNSANQGAQNAAQTNTNTTSNNQNSNNQSQGSTSGDNEGQPNVTASSSNGVIEHINTDNGNNSNSSNNGQNAQSAEVYPSQAYTNLLAAVTKDYGNAKNTYNKVKNQGYRDRSTDATIMHYMKNIDNNLRSLFNDKKNYNALNNNQKAVIKLASDLADELDRNYHSYPIKRARTQSDDDVY